MSFGGENCSDEVHFSSQGACCQHDLITDDVNLGHLAKYWSDLVWEVTWSVTSFQKVTWTR